MAVEKWVAGSGQGLTWGDAFDHTLTTLSALASGNAILSTIAITNGTSFDIYADVSINLASAAFTATNGNYVGVYLYPLNADGSTYGDGRFTSTAAGPPGGSYQWKPISIVAATQAQEGTAIGFTLPPGTFKFLLYNQGGIVWATGAGVNTCQYRTYNRSVA